MASAAKKIGVFTSGGDAPGMNAAIRAVVRSGIYYGLEVVGIIRGYEGMINGNAQVMNLRSVSNIIQKGGTILKTSRSTEFMTTEGRDKAAIFLKKENIDGIIAIGGNGTLTGLLEFRKHWDGQMIALPGTIDNDLYGTDYTIGFFTAVQTAIEAIDKIRDTADAHERVFLIEVMGRHAGFIALDSGIAGGAESILIPEVDTEVNRCATMFLDGFKKGKTSSIIVVAEGNSLGRVTNVANRLKETTGIDAKVVIIGHVQRGGSPMVGDRVLASKLGVYAVEMMIEGQDNVMAGEINGQCTLTSIDDAVNNRKLIDPFKLKIASILAI
ncbi:MAG: 6-phosphofructokinase [Candidatus Magnetoovum sp. WYHC-5]|nr:6-phosphofructokinase [Candidatus Magnetoovum sp. WYHC-5]